MPKHNRRYLKDLCTSLRSNLNPSEARLWKALKGKKFLGRKFRRQHSIGNYIVDFYCPAEKLVIEIDGAHHFTPSGEISDAERDRYMKSLGIKVLRIPNEVIHNKFDLALEVIKAEIEKP